MKKKLSPVKEKLILHWGEMGTKWGINRTVAQIHSLLYLSPKPLNAEEIADTLSIARSNVSTSLKELQGWGIVKNVHIMGDRRDHFESVKDVWEMFWIVMDERKKREIDPTLSVLRECKIEMDQDKETSDYTKERLTDMLEFLEITSKGYEQMKKTSSSTIIKMVKLGNKMGNILGKI